MSQGKAELRERLRMLRRAYVAALPQASQALLFLRPPQLVATAVLPGAVVGVYAEGSYEAPASRYARWFFERGHEIALPWFGSPGEAMTFRAWNPFSAEPLGRGPYGIRQPPDAAPELEPELVFVPLLGFTAAGERLGQGAGHYDRWLAAHPGVPAYGLAWDCQLVEDLPTEPHDRPLDGVITPTRLYGPAAQ